MTILTRAVLYSICHWKRSMLLFSLLLAVFTLVLSGLAFADAQAAQAEDLRGTTGASFTVAANNGYTLQPVTDEMIRKIAGIDGVETYNTTKWTILNLFHEGSQLRTLNGRAETNDLFYGTGCYDSEFSPLFLSGALQLTDGAAVSGSGQGLILCRDVAAKYSLHVGDSLQVCNGNPGDPRVSCQIAGLFEVVADETDEQATMAKPSSFYDFEDYIFTSMEVMTEVLAPYTETEGNGVGSVDFFVADAAQLDAIVGQVQADSSIDWDAYYLVKNNEVYERIESAVADSEALTRSFIIVTTAACILLILLLLSLSVRSRRCEMGILLATGEPRPAIILQQIFEVFLIAAFALPAAYFASTRIADRLGILSGAGQEIVISQMQYAHVVAVGMPVLTICILIAGIPAMRLHPKAILAKID